MNITRTPPKDFAISRTAVDVEFYLSNAFENVCGSNDNIMQDFYDSRAEMQRNADGFADWDAYLASGLLSLVNQPYAGPAISALTLQDQVISERARRLSLGFDYDFGDARGVHHIGTTEADLTGWDEVTKLSQAALALGMDPTIGIVTDTGPVNVTATEWQQILITAGLHRQPIFTASFTLQAMDPVPSDYIDDSYWP